MSKDSHIRFRQRVNAWKKTYKRHKEKCICPRLVSFFTDIAARCCILIIPIFLTRTCRADVNSWIDRRHCESTASILKVVSGGCRIDQGKENLMWSTVQPSLSQNSLAFAATWHFSLRQGSLTGSERASFIGKRCPHSWLTEAQYAEGFWLSPGLDTVGAVIGPLIALLFYIFLMELPVIFLIAFILP